MHLPLRRIFDDKRRLVIPVLAGLALNLVLFAGVVYPLGVRVRSMEAREQTAAQQLQAAMREDAEARGIAQGRDRTDIALKAFYKDVLPSSHAQARQATFLRLTQLAERMAAAHVGADMRGIKRDRNVEAAQRLRMMVQFGQHQAAIVMGIDIVGT